MFISMYVYIWGQRERERDLHWPAAGVWGVFVCACVCAGVHACACVRPSHSSSAQAAFQTQSYCNNLL